MQNYQTDKERIAALYGINCRIINKLCPGICPEYQEEGDLNE